MKERCFFIAEQQRQDMHDSIDAMMWQRGWHCHSRLLELFNWQFCSPLDPV